jgi:cyclopropane fatty-acyl-phospholipid synthase-like methyltransferase
LVDTVKIIQRKKNVLLCVVWPPSGSMVKEEKFSAKRIIKEIICGKQILWQNFKMVDVGCGRGMFVFMFVDSM